MNDISTENSMQHDDVSKQIQNRLHAMAADLRQKRDKAYNELQLANERLKLLNEDHKHTSATVEHLENTVRALEEKGGGSDATRQQRTALKNEVAHLSKEVHFQHTELVQKRNKLFELQEKTKQEKSMRASSLNKLQVFVQDRRKKIQDLRTRVGEIQMQSHDPTILRVEYIAMKKNGDDIDIQSCLPQLVKNQSEVLTERSKENQYKILHLQRIINGYHHNLKLCSATASLSNETDSVAAKRLQIH